MEIKRNPLITLARMILTDISDDKLQPGYGSEISPDIATVLKGQIYGSTEKKMHTPTANISYSHSQPANEGENPIIQKIIILPFDSKKPVAIVLKTKDEIKIFGADGQTVDLSEAESMFLDLIFANISAKILRKT